MAKTSNRKSKSPVPHSDQLAAVRRIADLGDLEQAKQRISALRKSFPGFKPLLGLAWEVEDRCGTPMLAAVRAHEWLRAVPGSRAALEALCTSADAAGLLAVRTLALQRLHALDGQNAAPTVDIFNSPLAVLSLEQAESIDLSRMHLADDNPAAAAAVLTGVDHPSARNNLALALFGIGDLPQARAVIEANWEAEPANMFALERALRWRCWTEGLDRCLGFIPTLRQATPRRAEDAIARVAALHFLDAADAAREAWEDSSNAPYWDHATRDQREMFDDLGESVDELPGDNSLWFPGPWTRAIAALALPARLNGKSINQESWDAQLDVCNAHVDYLTRAVALGDAAVRLLAMSVLKFRAKRADDAALASLKMLLKRPQGPDSARMDLLNWMVEEGLRNRDEPAEVWLTGSLRTVRSIGLNITQEARPSPFPPAGTALNERMHKAIGRGDLDEALALATQLHRTYPDQPSAWTNLAAIKEGLNYPAEEIAELYRQAYSLAPDYLFARCGLARCLADRGNLVEARPLLDGLLEREEWHYSEYRSFLMAQCHLALASGERDAARSLQASILNLEQSFAH